MGGPPMPEYPLLVPSYNRPGAPLIKLASRVLKNDYPGWWWVFVRRSQARDYMDAGLERRHLVIIPDSDVADLGSTRNWMLRWAHREGFRYAFDWDDDVFTYGIKLAEGHKKNSSRSTGNIHPWLDTWDYWTQASRLSTELFKAHPGLVLGSIQNQRWCKSFTATVQGGKTPRRTKILNVERLVENDLWCPREFRVHGEDIGNTAMILQYGWEIFTIGALTYDFIPETSVNLPSTLRSRDEERNRAIHQAEFNSLQRYDIKHYLRINKAYDDGSYMYGDVDWRKFRAHTGQVTQTYEFRDILDRVPLNQIPSTITK